MSLTEEILSLWERKSRQRRLGEGFSGPDDLPPATGAAGIGLLLVLGALIVRPLRITPCP